MAMNIIVLLPMLFGFGLLYWATSIEDTEEFLALAFRFMFIPLTFLAIHFAVIDATLTYGADAELVKTLASMAYYIGWLLFIVGVYYAFVVMGRAYAVVKQNREAKAGEKYD